MNAAEFFIFFSSWTVFIFWAGYKLGNVFGDNAYKKEWKKETPCNCGGTNGVGNCLCK